MDIFTTQLTRVVPVPIKPTSLKVKALVKNTAMSALSQDDEHLEDDEYYASRVFAKKSSKEKQSSENSAHDNDTEDHIDTAIEIDFTAEDAIDGNSVDRDKSQSVKPKQEKVEATNTLDATYDNIFTDKKAAKIESEKSSIEGNDQDNDKGDNKHLDLYA